MHNELAIFPSSASAVEYNKAYEVGLTLWPKPYKEYSIDSRFGKTHILSGGLESGPPIVLLHPAGCGSVIWCRNVNAFSLVHPTLAVDTIGEVNRSRVTHPLQTRDDLLSWMEEMFDALHIGKAFIVGNSFGGYLGALAAAYLPDRVAKLVLISPASTLVSMPQWMWHFFPGYFTGSKRLKQWAYDWIWQGFPADDFIVTMRTIASTCGTPKHVPPKVLGDDELRMIHAPTLLLIGDHEVIYTPAKAIERASRLVPRFEALIVPNANHNAEYTAADWVNSRILTFLQ
jgi:pimeloyl-ACP methyl ester carboxylesterase